MIRETITASIRPTIKMRSALSSRHFGIVIVDDVDILYISFVNLFPDGEEKHYKSYSVFFFSILLHPSFNVSSGVIIKFIIH